MCEYDIIGRYQCLNLSTPTPFRVKEHFTSFPSPNIVRSTGFSNGTTSIFNLSSYNYTCGTTLNNQIMVCPEQKCCNNKGICGGNINTQDTEYCTNQILDHSRYTGILGGKLDDDGHFPGQLQPAISQADQKVSINGYNKVQRHSKDKTLCGFGSNNKDNNLQLNMCGKNKCCNLNGVCGGDNTKSDSTFCINNNMGILNGTFDDAGKNIQGYTL